MLTDVYASDTPGPIWWLVYSSLNLTPSLWCDRLPLQRMRQVLQVGARISVV